MSKKFDGTLKEMLEDAPESWPVLVGRPGGTVEVVNSDIGTVTGAADKVIRVHGPPTWLLHVEAQAGPDASLPMRAQVYNTLLAHRHRLPVHTTILLLRPEANLSIFTGLHEVGLPGHEPYLRYRYQVLRVWQEPPERFLEGGPGTAPLAPISAVRREDLPGTVEKVERLIDSAEDPGRRIRLRSSAYVLLGLRYPADLVDRWINGEKDMEESSTFQAFRARWEAKAKAEGEVKGELKFGREMLLTQGRSQFGEPSERVLAALNAESSLARLLELGKLVLSAASWDDLFPPPAASSAPRRRGRRGS